MHLLLPVLLLAAPVPRAVAGPDLVDRALVVDAPIERVTVYSDRASVVRRTAKKVSRGAHAFRFPDLPGEVYLNTVRVRSTGAEILRIAATHVDRERMSIDQAVALIDELDALKDELARLDAKRKAVRNEISMLSAVRPPPWKPGSKQEAARKPPLEPPAWSRSMGFIQRRRLDAHDALRRADYAHADLLKKIEVVQKKLRRYDLGGMSDRRVQAIVLVQAAKAGRVSLELEYTVPGAAWWPVYDVRFDSKTAKVALASNALIQQSTGEAWDGVELRLSTAAPGRGIEHPELMTWTLGSSREMIPRPRADRAPPTPAPLPVPRILDARGAEEAARNDILRARLAELAMLQRMGARDIAQAQQQEYAQYQNEAAGYGALGDMAVGGSFGSNRGAAAGAKRERKRKPRRRAPPSPPPAEEPEMMMEFDDAEVEGEYLAPQSASVSIASTRMSSKEAQRRRANVQLKDGNTWAPARYGDRTLPAMVAGGFDHVFDAATRANVPTDGRRIRVPLHTARWTAALRYETTPALGETAYLLASVKNGARTPVLSGVANVFVDGDFASEARLPTTGSGGTLELPLGADQDLRITRHVAPTTSTKGVFTRKEVTDYEVRVEVVSYKKSPVTVDVFDVLPKTGKDDIAISLVETKPRLHAKPDGRNRLRWRLKLKPGAKETIRFVYRIERPRGWRLRQR